jgi:lysophospholipase L1-like esterase
MQLLSALAILSALSAPTFAASSLSFVLIGDSTTNNGTTVNSGGWSNGFCASLANVTASHCINTAHNGATTGSTITSGQFNTSLTYIRKEVAAGRRTLVTVQFGHNDMKIVSILLRRGSTVKLTAA